MDVTIQPATPDRWEDLIAVFGRRGDPARCWCAYLRERTVDYQDRDGNRDRLHAAVDSGSPPGVLGYAGGSPVGWASVAPSMFERAGFSEIDRRRDDRVVYRRSL